MHRLALRLGPVVVAAVVLCGCSSGHKSGSPASTTTSASSVPASTTTAASNPTSSIAASTSTAAPSPPTSTSAGPGPRITGFTIAPASPVSCNGATSIELTWTATGADSVALSIDGKLFAAFGGGPQNHLEYLACDGKTHTYLLTALAKGDRSASASQLVTSRPTS